MEKARKPLAKEVLITGNSRNQHCGRQNFIHQCTAIISHHSFYEYKVRIHTGIGPALSYMYNLVI